MTTQASAIVVALAQQSDAEIVEALSLLFSLRPDLQGHFAQICNAQPAPRLVGTISAFYPEKRFGFIKCDEVTQSFGMDTFLSDQEIAGYTVGSVVSFSVVTNKQGKPQARMLSDPPPGSQQWQPTGVAQDHLGRTRRSWPQEMLQVEEPPVKIPRIMPPAAIDWPAASEAALASDVTQGLDGEMVYTGIITAFYEQKHFGFIKSPGATSHFGMDVFLSDKEIGGFSVGSQVSFNIVANKEGKPQARNLRPADGSSELDADAQVLGGLAEQMPNVSNLAGFLQKPIQPDWGLAGTVTHQPEPEAQPEDDQRFIGTIKCFIAERHYGFLNCPECTSQFGFDAFLSDKEIGNFTNDDTVSFSVRVNRTGKPQAFDLRPAA
mmetsp:Transcript_133646/g.236562  ORF Transcript_133646/g.236562 Transcript_133646/m.236562 type:complete len:378 (-) Transcript_133646:103-1236(-)